jgi:diguanylate cyclase
VTGQKTAKSDETGKKLLDPRVKIFAWALLFSIWCGWVEFGQPLEDVIQSGRDYIRSHDAAQDIVVVGLDDKTAKELDGFQFPRHIDGEVVDTLFKLGAKRVFFDRAYADATTPKEDAAFAAALRRHRGRVFLGSMSRTQTAAHTYEETAPRPEFSNATDVVSLNGRSSPFGLSARLPYQGKLNGGYVTSMSARLAGVNDKSNEYYRPDWSIRIDTIPTISFVDLAKNRVAGQSISGRDVVVGPTSLSSNDIHHILSQGWVPGVYFHVVGAETLKKGLPENWGWIPHFVVGFILSIVNLFSRRRAAVKGSIVVAVATFGLVPLYLDANRITADIVPAILLFGTIAYRSMTMRRVKLSGEMNAISGLPNLTAIRQEGDKRKAPLIALKMRNYSEIAASFDQVVERAMIAEIRRRIVLSNDIDEIFHGEDVLLWFTSIPVGEELAHHLEGLKAILSATMHIDSREIDVSVSFGVDADQGQAMTSRIGSAMLCAEEAANGNEIWKFYDPQRRHEATWQLSLLSRLDRATDNGELWVAYQPKLDLGRDEIIGAEALVRWSHPDRGAIGPDDFIPIAEKHNSIEKLTAFVLDRAISDASQLNANGIEFTIAVNMSVQLLQMPDLLEFVDRILKRYNFPAEKLTLEITETGKLDRAGLSIAMMRKLAAHGIRISIDDYGTGNATLDYLKMLPANEVKIDRRFITEIASNQQDKILVGSTIEMAHSLGRTVVAEGVETYAELRTLVALRCDLAQGFLIGKPVDFSTLCNDLAQQQWRKAM